MTAAPEVVRRVAAELSAAGVPSSRVDAEVLVSGVCGVSRGHLHTAEVAGESLRAIDELVRGRARRIPLQYLLGTAPFRHVELAVGPGVFIPRPETEQLVELVLDWLRAEGARRPTVVDLGAGSGAVAVCVAQECPGSDVVAVEREPAAAAYARCNTARLAPAVALLVGELAHAVPGLDGSVDCVVSNPPYLSSGLELEPEVAAHEPAAALWGGGHDGLDAIRAVEAAAWRLLRPGGLLAVEHGSDQGLSAPRVFGRWVAVEEHRDLAGLARYVTATRPGPAALPREGARA